MFKSVVAKVFNKKSESEVLTSDVVLKALCAYRDSKIMSDAEDYEVEVINDAIDAVWQKMPVSV